MSKKTDAIYTTISRLEELNSKLPEISKDFSGDDIEEIAFEIGRELKNLRFWIDSLYLYNGKSTSRAKKLPARKTEKKAVVRPRLLPMQGGAFLSLRIKKSPSWKARFAFP